VTKMEVGVSHISPDSADRFPPRGSVSIAVTSRGERSNTSLTLPGITYRTFYIMLLHRVDLLKSLLKAVHAKSQKREETPRRSPFFAL